MPVESSAAQYLDLSIQSADGLPVSVESSRKITFRRRQPAKFFVIVTYTDLMGGKPTVKNTCTSKDGVWNGSFSFLCHSKKLASLQLDVYVAKRKDVVQRIATTAFTDFRVIRGQYRLPLEPCGNFRPVQLIINIDFNVTFGGSSSTGALSCFLRRDVDGTMLLVNGDGRPGEEQISRVLLDDDVGVRLVPVHEASTNRESR